MSKKVLSLSQGVEFCRAEFIPGTKEQIMSAVKRLQECVGPSGCVISCGGVGKSSFLVLQNYTLKISLVSVSNPPGVSYPLTEVNEPAIKFSVFCRSKCMG